MNLTTFPTRDALIAAAAERISDSLKAGIAARGAACAALSGGSTPEPVYRLLAAMPLDWPNITFALVDERFVPPSDPASNQAMIERALAPAFAAGARLKPMYAAADTAEKAADCADILYAPLSFDIALMGMGEDGHTASWFAGAAGLDVALDPATQRSVIALHAPQAAGGADRLSITRAALARARRVTLLITGPMKRARLAAALGQAPADTPVAALFAGRTPEVLWAP